MTFVGMGPLEILVVLMVAFIVLGPDRMLTAARTIGKVTGELRRLADGLPQISLDEEPTERPIVHRRGGPGPRAAADTAAEPPAEESEEPDNEPPESAGPVAFKPSAQASSERRGETETTRTEDSA